MFFESWFIDQLISSLAGHRGLDADVRVAIVGTPRSGTTLLGKLLTVDPHCRQIIEPFNPAFGIAAATRSFVAGDRRDSPWRGVIDRFIAARGIAYRRPSSDRYPRVRWLKGTLLLRDVIAARLFRSQRLVIKDPYLSLASQYLVDRHGMRVIFTVKHPATFFASLRRVGWHESLPLDELVEQGMCDAKMRDAATTAVARAALFWNIINRHALETQRRFPHAVTIWSHERFCREPDAEMQRLTDSLQIDYSAAMRHAVAHATQGDVVAPPPDMVHQLVRNSSELADSWRDLLSHEEERVLRTRCAALYHDLTGCDWGTAQTSERACA